jgi:GMP synthase (glutamine-hydrolysing)
MNHDTLVILDFGSQYAQLITRCVREQSVFCEQLPWNADPQKITALQPRGVILSGGPASVYAENAPRLLPTLLEMQVPLLGICYGMQALTHALGGRVQPSAEREYGQAVLEVRRANPLLPEGSHQAWMSHGDRIEKLPPGFSILASTENSPIAAMADLSRNYYGVQFHPEVKHTPIGVEIIRNFLFRICNAAPTWTPESIVQQRVTRIREQVGDSRVLSAVSGGVDSSVATRLVHQAVGSQLEAVFVDTGLLRKDEPEQVISVFQETLGTHLHAVEASQLFFADLKGITDPEEKRSRIGKRFIRIFEEQARAIGKPPFLVQGTIYPDVVESYSHDRPETETIKTHHNVGGLPERMNFELIEPLRYLFKDEVRRIGKTLGLPEELIWRQPFPGPGLAIRCLGEVSPDRVKKLRAADAIFTEELARADLLRVKDALVQDNGFALRQGSAQSFAVLLPVKTVGVMGDRRTYEDVIALRAVTTDDFMTADWSRLPEDLLARVSNRIVNEIKGVNRVVYDITSKPPGTIEWE